MNTIRSGSKGDAVKQWQAILNKDPRPTTWVNDTGATRSWPALWTFPLSVDGDFGQRTVWATEAWQAARGLVAEAIVGANTWAAAGVVAESSLSDEARFTEATYFTRANRQPEDVTLFVLHTAECAEVASAAENLASWGGGPNANQASWHYAIDNDSVTQSVRDRDVAWHAGPVNGFSIGFELAGRASQTPEQWGDTFSDAQLHLAARFIAKKIRDEYPHIPVRRLTAEDLAAGERHGFTGHVDITNGLKWGSHVDPGKHFPWDLFLSRVRACLANDEDAIDTLREPSVVTPDVATAGISTIDFANFVPVAHDGITWLVCPIYIAPVGIGEAVELAAQAGCELPSPGLVDAIWRAADLKVDANAMVRQHDGTPATMDSPETHADQAARLARIIGDRSLGRDFKLLAGAFKDVVLKDGKVGLYGWHRADGTTIQPFFGGHALAWCDYSQGLRLVRRT